MKRLTTLMFLFVTALLNAGAACAGEEFYGKIESRPEGKVGNWTIGGRQVAVTEATKLDDEDGPLVAGACVEVEYKGGAVKEIETEDEVSKCSK